MQAVCSRDGFGQVATVKSHSGSSTFRLYGHISLLKSWVALSVVALLGAEELVTICSNDVLVVILPTCTTGNDRSTGSHGFCFGGMGL